MKAEHGPQTAANIPRVTIPRWLLVALVDCHDAAAPGTPCQFVAEARRVLAGVSAGVEGENNE